VAPEILTCAGHVQDNSWLYNIVHRKIKENPKETELDIETSPQQGSSQQVVMARSLNTVARTDWRVPTLLPESGKLFCASRPHNILN
jgi:hypothetical protein